VGPEGHLLTIRSSEKFLAEALVLLLKALDFGLGVFMRLSAFKELLFEIYDLLPLIKRPKAISTIRTVVPQFEFILALGPIVCSAALTLHIPCLSRIF
jgi:hypothetical protein